jgi:hypothetical protein
MISPSASGRPDFDDSEERHFDAMGRQQCLDLIESHHLGRIAWQAADLPQILPISRCAQAELKECCRQSALGVR